MLEFERFPMRTWVVNLVAAAAHLLSTIGEWTRLVIEESGTASAFNQATCGKAWFVHTHHTKPFAIHHSIESGEKSSERPKGNRLRCEQTGGGWGAGRIYCQLLLCISAKAYSQPHVPEIHARMFYRQDIDHFPIQLLLLCNAARAHPQHTVTNSKW